MNELIFLLHAILVVLATFGALRLGREALVSWVALQAVLANLYVVKQIPLFGLEVTCSDVYVVGAMLGLNLLQEFWGKVIVKRTIWVTLGAMTLFAATSVLQLLYRPTAADGAHSAYVAILHVAPRILFASLAGYFTVQLLDMQLFGWLKQRFPAWPLGVRSGLSQLVCQTVDTTLFAILGLWGVVAHLDHVILASCAIKFASILLMTPLTKYVRV